MKLNIDHFVGDLNGGFGSPFLPKGFFFAEVSGKGFKFRIGDRDLEFDGNCKLRGTGTRIGKGKLWEIKRIGK